MTELRAALTPDEWARWQAFLAIEPLGDERADLRNALLCHTVIAAQIGSKKAPSVADFLLTGFWTRSESTEGGGGDG